MRLRRCGTWLVSTSHIAGVNGGRSAGCDRLLLPAVSIEVLEDRAGVKATVILVLMPKLQNENKRTENNILLNKYYCSSTEAQNPDSTCLPFKLTS